MKPLALALCCLAAAGGAAAQERTTPVGELLGRPAGEVAERLGLSDAAWIPRFAGVTEDGGVAFLKPNTLKGSDCPGAVRLTTDDGWPDLFVFADGRLRAVAHPMQTSPGPIPSSYREALAEIREARRREPGPLPLSGGVEAYAAEATARGFAPTDVLRTTCAPPLPPLDPKRREASPASEAWNLAFAALATAWFAPYLATRPFEAADRKSAAAAGQRLLAELRPGGPLPGGEAAFRSEKVVRWHASPATPDYAVATIDLGGGQLGGARDFIAIGVRDGRVEWIGTPNSHMGLCRDPQGRVTGRRAGCEAGTGFYRP